MHVQVEQIVVLPTQRGSRSQPPGGHLVPDAWYLVAGSAKYRQDVLGPRYFVPGAWYHLPGTSCLGPGTL